MAKFFIEFRRDQQVYQSQQILAVVVASVMLVGAMLYLANQQEGQNLKTKPRDSDKLPLLFQMCCRQILPEECAAELGVLQRRMKKKGYSTRTILLCLFWECLVILWAIYVQLKLENLWLPKDHQVND